MSLSVDGILGPGGALEGALEGYEHRKEQLAVARAVERAFAERRYLLAEAGTGTGKTLAYLVPAVLSGRKVVVSTATKTLQEQIFFKDIPLLRDRIGLSFSAAYLKGRSNYLCGHRFEVFDQNPTFASRDEARQWPAVRDWAMRTQTGDRAELDLPESFHTWNLLTSTADNCLGTRCPVYDGCFVVRARREAEVADVVVVNHHLFFADLSLRSASDVSILPRYDAVVFDEAHALEAVATDYFGLQVSTHRLEELSEDALRAVPPTDARHALVSSLAFTLEHRSDALGRSLRQVLGLKGDGTVRLTPAIFERLSSRIDEVLETLASLAALSDDDPELSAIRRRAGEIGEQLQFIRRCDSDAHVFWAESRKAGLFLRASPIDVADELSQRLYPKVDTIVFTSATLTAQGRFDFVAGRLGVPDGAAAVSVASPFDFARQVALYLPTHLPEPNEPGFAEAAADEIVSLAKVTGGRAFALFTSLRQMEAVHALAKERLPFQVLLQGERPKSALLDAFKDEPSVLFASHSFWEGVDVPGEALSLVVIDRLPFAAPNDPLTAARIERLRQAGVDPFLVWQLPQAIIHLRQGFGRLIRTRMDRGAVALLDKRVVTKAYGQAFLSSLPRATRVRTREQLAAWWAGRRTTDGGHAE